MPSKTDTGPAAAFIDAKMMKIIAETAKAKTIKAAALQYNVPKENVREYVKKLDAGHFEHRNLMQREQVRIWRAERARRALELQEQRDEEERLARRQRKQQHHRSSTSRQSTSASESGNSSRPTTLNSSASTVASRKSDFSSAPSSTPLRPVAESPTAAPQSRRSQQNPPSSSPASRQVEATPRKAEKENRVAANRKPQSQFPSLEKEAKEEKEKESNSALPLESSAVSVSREEKEKEVQGEKEKDNSACDTKAEVEVEGGEGGAEQKERSASSGLSSIPPFTSAPGSTLSEGCGRCLLPSFPLSDTLSLSPSAPADARSPGGASAVDAPDFVSEPAGPSFPSAAIPSSSSSSAFVAQPSKSLRILTESNEEEREAERKQEQEEEQAEAPKETEGRRGKGKSRVRNEADAAGGASDKATRTSVETLTVASGSVASPVVRGGGTLETALTMASSCLTAATGAHEEGEASASKSVLEADGQEDEEVRGEATEGKKCLLTQRQKQIRALKGKLKDIQKLLDKKAAGETLIANQLVKISRKSQLETKIAELEREERLQQDPAPLTVEGEEEPAVDPSSSSSASASSSTQPPAAVQSSSARPPSPHGSHPPLSTPSHAHQKRALSIVVTPNASNTPPQLSGSGSRGGRPPLKPFTPTGNNHSMASQQQQQKQAATPSTADGGQKSEAVTAAEKVWPTLATAMSSVKSPKPRTDKPLMATPTRGSTVQKITFSSGGCVPRGISASSLSGGQHNNNNSSANSFPSSEKETGVGGNGAVERNGPAVEKNGRGGEGTKRTEQEHTRGGGVKESPDKKAAQMTCVVADTSAHLTQQPQQQQQQPVATMPSPMQPPGPRPAFPGSVQLLSRGASAPSYISPPTGAPPQQQQTQPPQPPLMHRQPAPPLLGTKPEHLLVRGREPRPATVLPVPAVDSSRSQQKNAIAAPNQQQPPVQTTAVPVESAAVEHSTQPAPAEKKKVEDKPPQAADTSAPQVKADKEASMPSQPSTIPPRGIIHFQPPTSGSSAETQGHYTQNARYSHMNSRPLGHHHGHFHSGGYHAGGRWGGRGGHYPISVTHGGSYGHHSRSLYGRGGGFDHHHDHTHDSSFRSGRGGRGRGGYGGGSRFRPVPDSVRAREDDKEKETEANTPAAVDSQTATKEPPDSRSVSAAPAQSASVASTPLVADTPSEAATTKQNQPIQTKSKWQKRETQSQRQHQKQQQQQAQQAQQNASSADPNQQSQQQQRSPAVLDPPAVSQQQSHQQLPTMPLPFNLAALSSIPAPLPGLQPSVSAPAVGGGTAASPSNGGNVNAPLLTPNPQLLQLLRQQSEFLSRQQSAPQQQQATASTAAGPNFPPPPMPGQQQQPQPQSGANTGVLPLNLNLNSLLLLQSYGLIGNGGQSQGAFQQGPGMPPFPGSMSTYGAGLFGAGSDPFVIGMPSSNAASSPLQTVPVKAAAGEGTAADKGESTDEEKVKAPAAKGGEAAVTVPEGDAAGGEAPAGTPPPPMGIDGKLGEGQAPVPFNAAAMPPNLPQLFSLPGTAPPPPHPPSSFVVPGKTTPLGLVTHFVYDPDQFAWVQVIGGPAAPQQQQQQTQPPPPPGPAPLAAPLHSASPAAGAGDVQVSEEVGEGNGSAAEAVKEVTEVGA
uniref:Uncharacterized protein n=1 Tax=Chromera velia CCMP2878 TaxID=1169474 RepID=A0A0G4FDF0_9ALVE|eukprot:Cvel_3223.t1-p1 / transcript=Cvel_3223.t1 / gene=Cvel_3223 / organism=Chromera_velia_CCMP2878 / gene_product=hypothetical protein / transcript_product=hypothetical protein / location=Cvel_scaffold126:34139-39890(+) / protein_length=1631 / sequence_SO=supercontig / SO=protein_coding / is_pseudo=false